MENSNNTGKIIGALVIGAVVGAALGILFAPDKGSKTRSKLVGGAKDLAEDLKQKIQDEISALRSKAEELEEMTEDKIADITKNLKHKVDGHKH